AAIGEVVAHVRQPRLEEQVDLDPAAVDRPHRHLVEVAPDPVLAGLERLDHGMLGVAVVRGGVRARARVAAAHVPAAEAAAEAHPIGPALRLALLADGVPGRRPVGPDVVDVLAGRAHAGQHTRGWERRRAYAAGAGIASCAALSRGFPPRHVIELTRRSP